MKQRLDLSYELTAHTLALIADFREGDGRPLTRIFTTDGILEVNEQAYRIMDENCKDNGSSYKGREEGTRQVTHFQNRLPIVISEVLGLYAFPLRSPRHEACIWILHDHFRDVTASGKGKSIIHFKNGLKLHVAVSKHIVDNSYRKASHLRYCYSQRIAERRATYHYAGSHSG